MKLQSLKLLLLVCLLFSPALAQQARYERRGNGAPAGACRVGQTATEVYVNSANGDQYTCKSGDGNPSSSGTWVLSGNSAGGTGSVTSVAASGGAETTTGSAITTTGTIRGTSPVNAQSGTSYTILTGDRGKLVTHSNGSAIAVTLPQASASFPDGWYYDTANLGAGTVTITPTTSTIDGAANLALTTNQGVRIVSNGTNYFTVRGKAAAGGGGCTATLTMSMLLGSITVDMNSAVVQDVYTVPADRVAIVNYSVFHDATSPFNGGSTANMRIYNSGTGSIIGTVVVTSVSAADAYVQANASTVSRVVTAGNKIQARPDTAYGSANTVLVDVFGYLTNTSGVPVANVCGAQ